MSAALANPEPIGPAIPLPGGGDGGIDLPRNTNDRQADTEYHIVETDDDFRPLEQARPAQETRQPEQRQEQDESLATQDDAMVRDPETRQFRRRTKAEERQARRQGRERTFNELSQFKSENANLRAELDDLRGRVQGFEPRLQQIDESRVQAQISELDRSIQQANQLASDARRRLKESIVAADADGVDAALQARDDAVMAASRLEAQKNMMTSGNPLGVEGPRRQAQPERQSQQQAPLPARAQQFVQDFQAEHDWIRVDPATKRPADADSEIALLLDRQVAEAGFNPSTQDYWDELSDRMERYLPHRFAGSQDQQPQPRRQPQQQQPVQPERRGPMVTGSSDRAPASVQGSNPNTVYLSPQRKDAMMLAGVLERDGRTVADPVKFKRYLKQYSDYDRANGVARQ